MQNASTKKTVVVTGASGHVGGNLVRALLALGRPVRAVVHKDRKALDGLSLELVNADVCDLESLRKAFQGAQVVYHLAARISIVENDRGQVRSTNVAGTENVVQACLDIGARLVHFSSIHALEPGPSQGEIDESCALITGSNGAAYDRSKADGERAVRAAIDRGLDAIIINPTAIIGPYDFRLSHQGEAIVGLANGALPALIRGGFDWVDVRDVAAGAIAAEQKAPRGARYLLSGHWASVRKLAAMIEKLTGVRAPRLEVPPSIAYLAAPIATTWYKARNQRPLYTRLSIDTLRNAREVSHQKASRDLGYQSRPLDETLLDTLKWYGQYGLLKPPLLASSEPSIQ